MKQWDWEGLFWLLGFAFVCIVIVFIGFALWQYNEHLLDERVTICKIAIEQGKEVLCWDNLAN